MNLLLVCETPIIEHIFNLVCKKLNIELEIQRHNSIERKFDIIVVDQNLIDDKFNVIKQFSKRLGAISSEDLPFDKSRDFLIPRPFLPTTLKDLIQEQVDLIKEDERKEREKNFSNNVINEDLAQEDLEVTVPVNEYVESLVEDIYKDIEDNNDESIVNLVTPENGGVLDKNELAKINDILKDEINKDGKLQEEDWKNISDIIDDALEEVCEYEFDLPYDGLEPYHLVLSNYQMNDLKPLLVKLNQSIIDKLSSGESVDIKISLKDK